jgi:hypothetical protein
MHDSLEVDASVEEMENLQSYFAIIIQERIANDPDKKLEISKDYEFTENHMDRENIEENIKISKL